MRRKYKMGIFDRFKKENKQYTLANLQLNARLQPMHRFELEDMLEEGLKEEFERYKNNLNSIYNRKSYMEYIDNNLVKK